MENPKKGSDCLPCKLVGAGGMYFCGCYLMYQSKNLNQRKRLPVIALGLGAFAIGTSRLFNLWPFQNSANG